MAIGVHVARVAFLKVDGSGNVVKGDDPNATIRQHLECSTEHRVIADSAIPNTANNPTVKAYLEAEASDNYVLEHIDQNTIVTYLRTSSGGFSS